MTSRTSWTGGNGQGLTWGTLINSADMSSLANGSTVLSSVAAITNGTALDMFMDISAQCLMGSNPLSSGAALSFWLYLLQQDGTTIGDGRLSSGNQTVLTPPWSPVSTIPLPVAAAQTKLTGMTTGIIIPPGTFQVAIQNNSGYSFTNGTQTVSYRTYNINLNA